MVPIIIGSCCMQPHNPSNMNDEIQKVGTQTMQSMWMINTHFIPNSTSHNQHEKTWNANYKFWMHVGLAKDVCIFELHAMKSQFFLT